MSDVLIVVAGEQDRGELILDSPAMAGAIAALQQTIQADPCGAGRTVVVLPNRGEITWQVPADPLLIPLTFDLPAVPLFQAWLAPGHLYQVCRRVEALRQRVAQDLNYPVGSGDFWLPIVCTAKGPLYGEVIGAKPSREGAPEYYQPLHLSDRGRQPLYRLGQVLLRLVQATPAVYLMQFGFQDGDICFDRLYPFPVLPAIASLAVQTPDLFACHWHCLTGQPIRDLWIGSDSPYHLPPTA